MKIGLFSDPHYCKADDLGLNRRAILSYNKIKEAMDDFKKQGVELCLCLGDMTDCAPGDTREDALNNLKAVVTLIKEYRIPFYFVPGNHDFGFIVREDYKRANIDTPPYIIKTTDYDFIALDANFRSNEEHFDTAGAVWHDANVPSFQVEFLKNALKESSKKCIVLVHENLDPTVQEQHIIKNHEQIREIIKESGKVDLVIQGHYHDGNHLVIDGITYLTLPAMCIGEENHYTVMDI